MWGTWKQVRGVVQGVNFRRWTAKQAGALGLVGWVRNTPDGHVEGAAVGKDESVEKFKTLLWEGPSVANVSAVEIVKEHEVGEEEEGSATFTKFEIRRW
ncbi:Acylphosphatase [Punctularia strigosozonata HHB-11173 SS5]|uniref:Acylphosphatase n=1 Tax=Punctularia strigosozonata (strain HHB-11173) TaxID=741275 RepID=UPI00044164D9|nr:Acylphosphatase [Punctularia strigosozonata HHB-11173 SS5]EIN13141.1 Acylphosphatase [Punctularia strigosozonata HHB-11173 SS5]